MASTVIYIREAYFYLAQSVFGIFSGIGTGIGFAMVNLVPQQWLDKKRSQENLLNQEIVIKVLLDHLEFSLETIFTSLISINRCHEKVVHFV